MEATVDSAPKDAKISKGEVMAETEQANRINLIVAIVVVMSLIASVVFSFLGIARPMTRLNGALGEMAGGNLDVVIPGAGRGDEIGDLAKTVDRHPREHRAEGARRSRSQGRAGPDRGAGSARPK